MDPMTQRVAVLGTGIMGGAMARNVAAAGLDVVVWNRTRAKAEELRLPVADSAADAVRGADVVVTMLSDGKTTEEVVREASPAAGTVWVQQATVGIEAACSLAGVARELDLVYVDAPVLGTRGPAVNGQLVIVASGPDDVQERLTPIFDAEGARTMWLGPAGNGSKLKLAVNSWVLTIVEGVSEALTLTKAMGLDPQQFLDAVAGGATDAPFVQAKGKAMLAGSYEPQFPLWAASKDARLIMAAAEEAGADVGVLRAVHDHFQRAEQAGYGDEDLAATHRLH